MGRLQKGGGERGGEEIRVMSWEMWKKGEIGLQEMLKDRIYFHYDILR